MDSITDAAAGLGQKAASALQYGSKTKSDLDDTHGQSRPGSSRHGSSFLNKLHRRHDAKHHSEQAPLLANPEQDETPEPEAQPQFQPQGSYTKSVKQAVVPPVRKGIEVVKDGGNAARRGTIIAASRTTQHVKKNDKKYMAAAIALLAAGIIVLGVLYGVSNRNHKPSFCQTPSCVQAADTIIANMHPDVAAQITTDDVFTVNAYSIDPCVDFDQFVCGGFEQHHNMRSDQNEIYTGTLMADEVDNVLKQILEQPKSKGDDVDKQIFKMAKDDYEACMDEQAIRAVGLDPLKEVIDHVKGDLSTSNVARPSRNYGLQISTANDETRDAFLTDVMIDAIVLNAPALVNFRVSADDRAPNHQVLFASPVHTIGLPSPELYNQSGSDIMADYNNADVLDDYSKVLNETLSNFYQIPSNATAIWHHGLKSKLSSVPLSEKVIVFETKLASIVSSVEEEHTIAEAYNKIVMEDFSKMLPQIDMRLIYKGVARVTPAPKTIIVSAPDYFQRLSGLLQETDKTTLQAFFVWKVIQAWADRVEDPGLSSLETFNAMLKGTETGQPEERWRKCVRDANHDLGWITSRFYINDEFDFSLKNTVSQIIDGIKVAFTRILIASTWMSQEDRETAATKARSIEVEIGYPNTKPNIEDASSVEDYYRFDNLEISKDDYFTNGVGATQQQVRRQWIKAAGSKTEKDEWEMYSTTVNAYYNPTVNKVFVPAAMLQPPMLYDPSLPSYISYGALGSIAGHEVSHAFDPIGSRYDANGTYNDWWSDETTEQFYDKAQCFADQYSSYTIRGPNDDLNVNGNLTLAEAIADAGGAHAAYEAWSELEQRAQSKHLPGLEKFTKGQIFWLSYGTFWCSKVTEEQAQQIVLADPHGPKSVRILGTVANSKGFREAWNCPSKEPTCELW